MSPRVRSCIWLCVALFAVCAFLAGVRWEEFEAAISSVTWPGVLVAMLLVLCSNIIVSTRWLILLRVHEIQITLYKALRLTYLGLFYNNVMPGSVGGDLVKGWFIAHHCDRGKQIKAITTVFVDRLAGLISMLAVAAVASFFVGSELTIGGVRVRDLILCILGAFVVAAAVLLSRRIRKTLMLSHLVRILPFERQLRNVVSAIRLYRHHLAAMLGAILITIFTQALIVAAVWMIAQSLRLDNVRFAHCLMIMPIIWLISAAIPVPGGLGVVECLFIPFFARAIDPTMAVPGATAVAQAATLALLHRLMISVCSGPGALVPLFEGECATIKNMLAKRRSLPSAEA